MAKKVPEVFESEYELMLIIWKNNPIRMKQLVADAFEVRQWKRTTVYTMIKRLGDRGIVTFEDGVVTAQYSKDEVQLSKAVDFMDKIYDGKVSNLMSAFVDKKEISKDEATEIKKMLDDYLG